MTKSDYEISTHFNCKGCKRRCITDKDYTNNVNLNGEKLDWTCLVRDDEIDTNLDKPNCYELEEE